MSDPLPSNPSVIWVEAPDVFSPSVSFIFKRIANRPETSVVVMSLYHLISLLDEIKRIFIKMHDSSLM